MGVVMILCSDLHLTERERDEYRWEFLDWLAEELDRSGEDELFILGDLTDQKDGHSAKLVNRIIDTLFGLPANVTILKGNHDYTDADCPFFRFLDKEMGDNIRFVSDPLLDEDDSGNILLLPHTRTPLEDWSSIITDFSHVKLIFCHQTFNGADAGKGHMLASSLSSLYFSQGRGFRGKVLSGDVHVPQKVGDVTYVGCPYPVAFGDMFTPRILFYRDGKLTQKKTPSIHRWSLDLSSVDELADMPDLQEGDQAKVRMHLPRSEFGSWEQHKMRLFEIAKKCGVQLFSVELHEKKSRTRSRLEDPTAKAPVAVSAEELLRTFCRARGLDEAIEETGVELMKEEKR